MFGAETIFRAFFFFAGTEEMYWLEHRECPAWKTRNVLLRTHGMSRFEHTECPASNTRNVFLRTQDLLLFLYNFVEELTLQKIN